jgi:Flp pilus assembly protein TadD
MTMEVPAQAVRTLMEVGVAASCMGMYRQATEIFQGIAAVRPESDGPVIGLAIAHMNNRSPEEAIKVLRDHVLSKDPGNIEAKMILGVALKLAGRNAECDNVIKELNATGDDRAKAFAASLAAR